MKKINIKDIVMNENEIAMREKLIREIAYELGHDEKFEPDLVLEDIKDTFGIFTIRFQNVNMLVYPDHFINDTSKDEQIIIFKGIILNQNK